MEPRRRNALQHRITALAASVSLAAASLTGVVFAQPAVADQPRQTFATGLTKSAGSIVDPAGRIWVSDAKAGFCRLLEPANGQPGRIEHPLTSTDTTTKTCLGGTLPDPGQGPAVAGSPATVDPTPASPGSGDEVAFIPDAAQGSAEVIRAEWNPSTAKFEYLSQLTIFDGDLRPNAASDGPDGNIYLSFAKARSIVKIADPTADHPSIESIASVATSSLGLAATHRNSQGLVVVYVAETAGLTVFTAPDDGVLTNYVPTALYNVGKPTAIHFDWQSMFLYTGTGGGTSLADIGKDKVSRIDLNTDAVDNQWALGFSMIGGLGMRDGKLLVMEDPGQLDPAKPTGQGKVDILSGAVARILSGPTAANGGPAANPAYTNDSTPTFTVSSDPAGPLQCSLTLTGATAVWQDCTSGSYTPAAALADGAYSFAVRTGPGGIAATRDFTIDTVAPAVPVITAPTAGQVVNGRPLLGVTSAPGTTLKCSVDSTADADFFACAAGNPFTLTTEGSKTLRVKAIDQAGNVSAAAAVTVTVDLTPPQLSISAPAEGSTVGDSTSLVFSSTSTDVAGFRCRLDTNAFTVCTSPKAYTSLPNGSHRFEVEATDNAGNITVAGRNFTVLAVDTTPPVVTASPAAGTYGPGTSITLAANEPASIYYTVDGSTPTPSSTRYASPIPLTASMTVKYFAVDSASNSSAVAQQAYVLDSTPPTVTVSPASGTYPSGQQITLAANEPASIYYTADGSAPTPASTKYTGAITLTASITLRVIAVDSYGNSSTAASYSYQVTDTTAPVVTVTPVGGQYPSGQLITLSSNEPATIYFTTDGSAPSTASTKYTTAITLTAGITLKYFAVDTAGNSSVVGTQVYTVAPAASNVWKDYNGDSKNDVLARDSGGTLWLYPGNGTGGWLAQSQTGTGWNAFNLIVTTRDFSGDKRSDVLARDTNGVLWLYPGNGSGGWLAPSQIGPGWSGMTMVFATGDFNGDVKADVLARDSNGALWLYPGNGAGGFGTRVQVGSGWNGMTAIFSTGDFNGDGKTDVLARDSNGALWFYPGNGSGGWLGQVQVGSGWSVMTAMIGIGDFDGDGKNDVLARDSNGNLFLYPGNGSGGWLTRSQVGWGWGGFTSLP